MGEERPWPWERSYPPGVRWDAPLAISTLPEMLDAFTRLGVDPCGERGEYHTVVVDAPAFSSPLDLVPLDQVSRGGCWALDFTIDEHTTSGRHAARI